MKRLPAWFPGAGFKWKAIRWAETLAAMAEGPYQYVKQQIVSRIMYTHLPHLYDASPPPCRHQGLRNHP